MTPGTITLINAIVLIAMGGWGYVETQATTSLIPAGFGALFLVLTPGMQKENKVVAHIVVLLTFLLIGALASKPLMRAIDNNNTMAIFRVCTMILVSVIAMIVYIKSFIDARKARS